MFFWLVFLTIEEDEYCGAVIKLNGLDKDYYGFSYDDDYVHTFSNDGESNYYGTYPFMLKYYVKYQYCSDWVKYYEENITDSSKCIERAMFDLDTRSKCEKGHYIKIVHDIGLYDTYNLTIIDRKNESHNIRYHYNDYDRTYTDIYYEQFEADVYVNSIYNDEMCYIGKFESWPDDDFFRPKNHSITLSMIPVECKPYKTCFYNMAPHFHDIQRTSTFDDESMKIGYKSYGCYEHKYPFNSTAYMKTGLSCELETPHIFKTLEAIKGDDYPIFNITNDLIPPECKIENYPDDNVKYEPDHNKVSNIPYTFIYEGDCDKFDAIVQKCKNNTLNYPFCSFTNNAIDALCYSDDVLKNININTEKIFIILSNDDHFLSFNLKHPTVVHIKATDYKDPEMYFQKYSDPPSKNLTLKIEANKISFLTISNINLTNKHIYDPDIILDTLFLKYSNVMDSSTITVNHIINEYSDGVYGNKPEEQYTIVVKNHTNRPTYQIRLSDNNFGVYERNWYEDYYSAISEGEVYTGGTSTSRIYGINFVSHFFDVEAGKYVSKAPYTFNLSLYSLDDELSNFNKKVLLEDQPKYYVNLTTSNEWYAINHNIDFYFTAHHDYINLESHMDTRCRLKKMPVYEYHPVNGWAPKLYQPIDINDTSLKTYIIITDKDHISTCNYKMNQILSCKFANEDNWYCTHLNWDIYDINHILDGKCITPDEISDTLSNIMPETDKLIIENDVDNINIDFNDLPHQCVVKITSFKQLFDSNSRERIPKTEDESKLIWKSISINGDIKSKVSYLTVSNSFLSIKNAPLNIHTLRLILSTLEEFTYAICTNDLIVDFSSHAFLFDHQNEIQVKQYGIQVPYEENELSYRIQYNTDRVELLVYRSDYFNPIDDNYGYIPYNYADTIALIIVGHDFEFYEYSIGHENININITLLNEDLLHNNEDEIDWVPLNESKYNVSFINPVSGCALPINISFTAYHDLVYLDYNPCFTVTKYDWVYYTTHPLIFPTPSPAMTPMATMTPKTTHFPTPTPVPEKIVDLYDETKDKIDNPKQLDTELKTKFNQLKDEEKPHENLVVVVNANSIYFKSELDENQYIKPISNAKIDFIGGNLNMVLPNEGDVTISLKNSQDVKLKLKGSGNITFKQEDKESNIIINETANINGSLLINVPKDVIGISVNSLELSNNGEIKCISENNGNSNIVPITVQSVNIQPYSEIEMNKVIVNETLTVAQTAQITLHDVNLTKSKITYNLVNFNDLNSILLGEFNEPPESFDINLMDSTQSPIIDKSYLIAHGAFNNNCDSWKEKIKFGDSKIEKICSDYRVYYNKAKLASDKYLYMRFIKDNLDDGKGDDKGKLGPGAIAGIVIGVIAAIAIVVIVVIIVIKKKKGSNSSVQENNEDGAENI